MNTDKKIIDATSYPRVEESILINVRDIPKFYNVHEVEINEHECVAYDDDGKNIIVVKPQYKFKIDGEIFYKLTKTLIELFSNLVTLHEKYYNKYFLNKSKLDKELITTQIIFYENKINEIFDKNIMLSFYNSDINDYDNMQCNKYNLILNHNTTTDYCNNKNLFLESGKMLINLMIDYNEHIRKIYRSSNLNIRFLINSNYPYEIPTKYLNKETYELYNHNDYKMKYKFIDNTLLTNKKYVKQLIQQ